MRAFQEPEVTGIPYRSVHEVRPIPGTPALERGHDPRDFALFAFGGVSSATGSGFSTAFSLPNVDPDKHLASQGVARRLGSTNLRRVRMPFPFEDVPMDAWGQTREQWRGALPRLRERVAKDIARRGTPRCRWGSGLRCPRDPEGRGAHRSGSKAAGAP